MNENVIVYITVAFAAGICFAGFTSWPLTVFMGLACLFLTVGLIAMARGRGDMLLPCLVAIFFLAGAVRLLHSETIALSDISRFTGKTATFSGTVVEVPDIRLLDENTQKVRYTVAVDYARENQGTLQPVSGKLTAAIRQKAGQSTARYGDKVTFMAKIAEPHNYNNPGAYDFTAALKRQGITARAGIIGESFIITDAGTGGWHQSIAALRSAVKLLMNGAMAPDQAAVLFGMLFGGYTEIPKTVVNDFAATGLVHILSVSGTHIALVAGIMLWLGRAVGLGPVATAVVSGIAILLYGLMSGFTPPVFRSAAMGIISLSAMALGREKDARTALTLSALVMLVITPGLIYDLSFQLSFAATAGLVFLYPSLANQIEKKLPPWLSIGLAVTIAAQLSVLPILAWYFNSLSFSAFAANIILLPAIEAVVVAGLAGTLMSWVWTLGGSIIFAFCGVAVNAILLLTSVLAALPGSSVYLPPFGYAFSAVYYCMLFWLFGYKPSSVPDLPVLFQRASVIQKGVTVCIVGSLLVYSCWPRPAAVHFIDVGQGDAVLVTTPHGRAVLIDAGGVPGDSGFDIGDRVVVPYLKHYGVLSLDYLVLTHGHQDHAGGAAAVATALPVKNVMLAAEPHSQAVINLFAVKNQPGVIPALEGQTVILDGVTFEIVHTAAVSGEGKGKSSNEASTVIRISFGDYSFLVTGDLTAAEEKALVTRGLSTSTVLKLAHHGAKTSSSQEFLQAVSPKFAVISAGYRNRYGHPHAETIKRLEANGVAYFRTDLQGAVVFRTDGKQLAVETFLH